MKEKLIDKRWRKTYLMVWFLQFAPFIRFIGVSGSMSFGIIKNSSDIDLFIIAKNKRIWTCYYFVRLLCRTIGQLRYGKLRSGKMCPNRFVTDKYLIINPQNSYLAKQYCHLMPVFDDGDYYNKFLRANKWIDNYGCDRPKTIINLIHSRSFNILRHIIEMILSKKIGNWLEKIISASQLKRIAKEEPTLNQKNSSVVANNNEIRIHPYLSK